MSVSGRVYLITLEDRAGRIFRLVLYTVGRYIIHTYIHSHIDRCLCAVRLLSLMLINVCLPTDYNTN